MPRYTVQSPDGRTFTVEAPEGATKEQVMAKVQQAAKASPAKPKGDARGSGWGAQFLEGVLPGSSEALGGVFKALSDNSPDWMFYGKGLEERKKKGKPNRSLSESYDAGHHEAREDNKAWALKHPKGATAAQLGGFGAGMIIPTTKVAAGASLAQKAAAASKAGGIYGLASGAASSEGDGIGNKLLDAGTTGLIGTMTGAVTPYLLKGAGIATRPLKWITDPVVRKAGQAMETVAPYIPGRWGKALGAEGAQLARDPVEKAANTHLDTDLRQGTNPDTGKPWTPTDVRSEVARRQAHGVPAAPADIHESARRSFGAAARAPGPATAAVRRAIDRRQAASSQRVATHISDTLGPTTNVEKQAEALKDHALEVSRPLYDISDAHPVDYVNEMQELLSRPSARDALQVAGRQLQDEGIDTTAHGLVQDADGVFSVGRAPSMPLYDRLKGVLDGTVYAGKSPMATPDITRQSRGAATIRSKLLQLMDGDGNGPRIPQAGTDIVPPPQGGPLDSIRPQGAPEVPQIADGLPKPPPAPSGAPRLPAPGPADPLPGNPFPVPFEEPAPSTFGRRLTPDEPVAPGQAPPSYTVPEEGLNPYWKPARDAYAGPIAAKEALELGETMAKEGGEDISNALSDVTGTQRDFFRLGHRSGLAKDVKDLGDWGNAAARVAGSASKREGLAAAHGGLASELLDRTNAEHEAHQTWKAVRGNSMTADREAEMAAQDQQIEGLAKGFLQMVSGRPGQGAGTALGSLMKGGTDTGAVKGRIAEVLGETDPTKLDGAIKDMLRERARRRMVEKGANKATQRGSRVFGSLLGTNLTEPLDDTQ